jgi:hypothetical protein
MTGGEHGEATCKQPQSQWGAPMHDDVAGEISLKLKRAQLFCLGSQSAS